MIPKLPFGPPKIAAQLRKKAIELFSPYIQKRRESKEEIDDYLSIWAQSPHVSGELKGQDYTNEEITNNIIGKKNVIFIPINFFS